MLLREILKISAALLGLKTDIDTTTTGDPEAKRLLECADLVMSEVTSDYFPLYKEEKIITGTGCIYYDELLLPVLDIAEIRADGESVRYECYPFYLKTVAGREVVIKYAYLADGLELDSDISLLKVSPRTFALGICAYYSLMNGMPDEAVLYDRQFKDSLIAAARKRGEIKMRVRNWG